MKTVIVEKRGNEMNQRNQNEETLEVSEFASFSRRANRVVLDKHFEKICPHLEFRSHTHTHTVYHGDCSAKN